MKMMTKNRLAGFFYKTFSHALPIAIVLSGALGVATSADAQGATPPQTSEASSELSNAPSTVTAQTTQSTTRKSATSTGQEAASSGSDIEEVLVTATRRAESVLDVPSSISAVAERQLQEAGAQQAEDVVHMVPGLAYTENSAGQAVLAVRGIQTSAVFGNLQQAAALYFDDVPVLDLTIPWTVPRLQLFDVNRVEVLRGPQGTLFGAGALSGAMRIITNKPDMSGFHAATDVSLTALNGGEFGGAVNAMVNLPLVADQLAVRAVGYYDKTPGWINNPTLGDAHTNPNGSAESIYPRGHYVS
jgi:outer membrane receptor protein involved in Fe transport